MTDVGTTVVDAIAVTGAVLMGIFLILVSSNNPSLFGNTEYDSLVNSIVVVIASVISYTLGKRSKQ